MMSIELKQLPEVIQSFIAATNKHDGQAFVSAFADDALVNDVARNFWGKGEISKWGDAEIIAVKITMKPDEAIEHYGEYLVTALIDGDYDKSKVPDPLYLDYFFTLRHDKIVRLIITKNKVKSAK